MYSVNAIKDALMNTITSNKLDCTPSARRRCNSVESVRILAESVNTKLALLGYSEDHLAPAICMSAQRLCSDWKGLDKLTDLIVEKYSAAVPAGGKGPSGGDRGGKGGLGEGEQPQDGQGEGDGGQGQDQEGEGQGQGGEGQGEEGKGQGEEGEGKEGEGDGEGDGDGEGEGKGEEEAPVPPSPRQPEADGYLKPKEYDLVKSLIEDGYNVLLVGPRGTGKTEMALRIFSELERRLYMLTSPQTRHEVTGYADANGVEVPTQITQAITDPQGGLLLEEMDRSMPEALIPMNAMLANGVMDVPVRGMVKVEPTLAIIATANTKGGQFYISLHNYAPRPAIPLKNAPPALNPPA